ncbi:MAG: TonB-dependent receptor [Ignavibacteriae bacterium]|nr:TonB-dependent receptor [Ignavibacteriota bacterium]
MKKYIFLILLLMPFIDKLSLTPLPGAVIQIVNVADKNITQSDINGNYVLTNVVPDRYEIKISYIGYKNVIVPNVVVSSGKETILDIKMEEDLVTTDEIDVTVNAKDKTINDLATNSARTFSMEEVNRYAGCRSDPARLVSNFAGVNAPDDSRNDIVIRGNSPVGVLWRIDGMNVTNPNHFASIGTTGGAVSALNTNMLKSSDFFTSAFPSEYGNAISGVFDLGFRNGNTQKRETTLQLGVVTGIEAVTEGPINRDNGSSYLIGYRYSLAGIAQAIGINIGTPSTPSYQDLSFKVNSGNTKYGTFSLFGILAASNISITGGNSNTLYGNGNDVDFDSKIGIAGLNHLLLINSKSFISSSVGINYSKTNQLNYDSYPKGTSYIKEENNTSKTGYNFITSYNFKINPRLFIKTGVQAELMKLYLYDRTKMDQQDTWKQIWDYDSYTTLAQAFAHVKYSFSEKFTLNTGIHAQKFFLNNSFSVEPRFGLKYNMNNISSFSLGYGLHSQIQPINVYFLQTQNADGSYNYDNKNLDFTKSHHFVLGYDLQPFTDWRIKAEVYYQYIYNVPVNTFSSSYSMLNTGATFKTDLEDSLANSGTGKNYGAELTIEKFFSNGYYGLFTVSVYDSKYTASDGAERNTAFNGNYVYNILAGKEWKAGSEKRNKITIDFTITGAGGKPYTPIDLLASQITGQEQLENNAAYTMNYTKYFRVDFKVGYTLNSSTKKMSHSFYLDLQNITNNENVFSQTYDNRSRSINTTYQLGIFPNFVYKFQF